MTAPPPSSSTPWRGPDTGERLRSALDARSSQIDPDDDYRPYGDAARTRQGSGPHRPGSGRTPTGSAPLLPRWAKVAVAAALLVSAAVGAGLGLHASDEAASDVTLPPPRETSYGSDRARVAITAFYRQGKFVTMDLALTNLAAPGSKDNWSVNSAFGMSSGYDLSGIRLLDPVGGTSIRPAEDAEGNCLCTRTISLSIAPDSTSRVSAQFPAPVPSVKTLTVDIPGIGSFRDVPLG